MEFALASSHSSANTEYKSIQIQIHKNTNIHKYIQTQIHTNTNTRASKYKSTKTYSTLVLQNTYYDAPRLAICAVLRHANTNTSLLSCTHLYTKYICLPTTTTTAPFSVAVFIPGSEFWRPGIHGIHLSPPLHRAPDLCKVNMQCAYICMYH